jgi:hypothetical protein
MNTAITTKRKLIDIPPDVLRVLSIKAAIDGTNVKNLIEHLILTEAHKIETATDAQIYLNLLKSDPEGKQYLNNEEKLRFETRLGI